MQRRRPGKSNKIRWRKIGRGIHHHWDGQIVRPGEILLASESEVTPFGNLFVALDPLPSMKPFVGLRIVKTEEGMFNVINESSGATINDRLLTKEEAEDLVIG